MALRAGHITTIADFDLLGVYALKTANESVTSSTTLQNDDELAIPLAGNAKYIMDGFLFYQGASSPAGDLKMDFLVPSGGVMKWANFGVNPSGLTQYNVVGEGAAAGSPRAVGTNGIPGSGGIEMSCAPRGYISTSSTSANLQFRFAQNVSSATATTVLAGSWLRVVRVA
jgi:hypothetical protein